MQCCRVDANPEMLTISFNRKLKFPFNYLLEMDATTFLAYVISLLYRRKRSSIFCANKLLRNCYFALPTLNDNGYRFFKLITRNLFNLTELNKIEDIRSV